MPATLGDFTSILKEVYEDAIDEQVSWCGLFATDAQRREAAAALADRKEQRRLDRRDGPRFGPGRFEWRIVMQPVWRRERIRARAQELMPGKRPGRFVR